MKVATRFPNALRTAVLISALATAPHYAAAPTSEGIVVVKETADTVFVITAPSLGALKKSFPERVRDLRHLGIGGSGGAAPGVLAVDIRPIAQSVKNTGMLRNARFHFSRHGYEPFFTSGGAGYAGIGRGIRIGGGSTQGHSEFLSEPLGAGDSVAVVRIELNYGGFLVEKATTTGALNYVAGGYIGGGRMVTAANLHDRNNYSAFAPIGSDAKTPGSEFQAGLALVEVHGAITYSLHTLFHLGMELTLPTFISLGGFSPYTPEFVTVNPGLKLKILFGILG